MIDKDQNEIRSVCTLLLKADLLLGKFLVLKYFNKKKVSEFMLPATKKNIFGTLKNLSMPIMKIPFPSTLSMLGQQDSSMFKYICTNWVNCKDMWATYLRSTMLTFGNYINNHIEAENRQLTHFLTSTISMSECMCKIMLHNSILNDK